MSPSMKNPPFGPSLQPCVGKAHVRVPSLACPAAHPLSPCTTSLMAQDRSKAVPPSKQEFTPKPGFLSICCRGAFSTLLPAWLLKMKQSHGWLQLIPCYHASGLMWIRSEAREAACSDMNQAEPGMVSSCFRPIYQGCSGIFKEQK